MEKKTLDARIEEDLPQIYQSLTKQIVLKDIVENLEPIAAAKELSEKLFDGDGKVDDAYALSCYGLPGYFTGDRDAQTVMVMLNPGNDVSANDNPFNTMRYIRNYGISLKSEEEFIRTYKEGYRDFGKHPTYKVDNFDMKQAVFLSDWEHTGVTIPKGFPDKLIEKSDKKITEEIKVLKEEATRNVLMQKLQLELIPYASRKFDTTIKNYEPFYEYLETVLHEIFRTDRTYVIFCSRFFERLFETYRDCKERDDFQIKIFEEKTDFLDDPEKGKKKGMKIACTPVRIKCTYNERSIVAIIAHTFPVQSLPNAYEKMREYGRFCYECWKEIRNIIN